MGLIEKFEEGTKNWKAKLQEDEWYFVRLREQIISDLQSHEAFDAISDAVDIVLKQTDEFLCAEGLKLLIDLSRIANTTEMHPILSAKWDSLCNHVIQFGEYHKRQVFELNQWYRKNLS